MKIIVYILLIVFISVVIVSELILPDYISSEDFIRVIVMVGALILIAYMVVVSPAMFSKLHVNLGKHKPSEGALFKIPSLEERKKTKEAGQFRFTFGQKDSGDKESKKLFRIPQLDESNQGRSAPQVRKMFGTAGIRGLINIEITPLLVMKMCQVFADYLCNRGGVAIGYDSRYGADILAMSSASGLRSRGVNVVDCGVVPTGGLATYVVKYKLNGGVLITGSHTPFNMTGIIILKSDGSYLDDQLARELEKRYAEYDQAQPTKIPLEALGLYRKADDALRIYRDFLLEKIDQAIIKSKKYHVLVDPANGPATLVLPELLKNLGCEVSVINSELAPVPKRSAEPRRWNLAETAAKVKENNCILGIATDVDADRVLFIDETGKVMSEDLIGAVFARDILNCGDVCVTPINSSGLISEVVADRQAKLHYCCIGQPATLKVVRDLKADFSYEESGKYYFARDCLWPDGILASLKLLEIMARQGKLLSELASGFSKFFQVKHNVKYAPHMAEQIMARVKKIWLEQATENMIENVTIDGLKRVYNDKSWLLLRKSGTEKIIRIYADALSQERADELVRIGEDIVNKAMGK
ncbi:MAG: hypothetical protein WC980_05695 [Candidatus Brocadiia bacterium]